MIVKEHRERQQDIKGFEKLEDIITKVEQTEMTWNVEKTERPKDRRKESKRSIGTYQPKSGTLLAYEFAVHNNKEIINLFA